ncbi:CRISPR-associated protein, Csd1 family [Rhodomicrobium vannielii ATCC 17100]|uniref:CRISPR-associated protein, Csd1 family n=1 Tax=Rhodomicrobium vannielii (strain ATCC 17100 / DSM 162 / LMG 4299 / NCIMB 10020 / ATH 3.1.1) TaxID=648757 RepID=E3I4H1_RHOVT|nr:type I-C CRISPR-associated protein Cas8c/Csd1 [Rhodomicrobium vannielii]ADP70486.1 CRISPR-associated protein, Csd1 family [Rhodomicrobium vannielii ATCC 17100]
MSILASLAKAYGRLPDAPPFGFSSEKIGFLISLNEDGTVACPPVDLRQDDKKRTPRTVAVPASFKRPGITPRSFFLWDNSAYALGVTGAESKDAASRHKVFCECHLGALRDTTDPGLKALVIFLKTWFPRRFDEYGWPEEMKDQNIIFCLEADRRANIWLHDRPAAKALCARLSAEGAKSEAVCLISGQRAPVARLHPAIKGVWGAQSAGASIVSFNLDAFSSYGHEQGDNAPVSEAATFAYTTALNRFLEKDSGHRIQIGDASVVFWADASAAKAAEAENIFAGFWDDSGDEPLGVDEGTQAQIVGARLKQIRNGEPLRNVAPDLAEGVRFYVLALAPNAARLSIRFYFEDDFGAIAANYQRFLADMQIEPPPRDGQPALWKYLAETAVLKKRENVPPNLAGEWMRAILGGTRYPQTLLATVLMRLRADKDVNALRVAILKALLIRNNNRKDTPVALKPDYPSKGYQLGRLFAVYERIQSDALGAKVNATIKDKFYGSASAQPRKVFGLLEKGSANHLSKIGKQSPGRKVNLEKLVGEIMGAMDPSADPFPNALSAEDQALFGLGYYHQRNEFFKSTKNGTPVEETAP